MKKFIKNLIRLVVILVILIAVIFGLLMLFRNPIAKFVIEKGGGAAAGAKVDVEGVYLKPFKLHITWDRLQVADRNDTWKNLFETGTTEFSLAFRPLLAGKVIIEKMQLEELRFATDRETDGSLPAKPIRKREPSKLMQKIRENLNREKDKIPVFNPKFLKTKIDVDTLLEVLDFQTPAKADSVKDLAEARYAYWEQVIEDKDYERELELIRSEVKKIKPDEIENLTDLQTNFTAANNVYNTTKELYDEFNKVKENLAADLEMLRQLKGDIPAWIESDYRNAVNLAKLPDVAVRNIALMLFGDRITDGIMRLLEYIERTRDIAEVEEKAEVKEERMPHLPSFWIKELILSASPDDKLSLSGQALHISNNQSKTGEPIRINLSGVQENLGKISLGVILDHRSEDFKETVNILVDEVPVRNFELANFDLLPTRLNRGKAMLKSNVNLSDEIIYGEIAFQIRDIAFDYGSLPEMDDYLVRISRSITEAIDRIDLDADVTQKPEYFRFKLNSNLDNVIADQLKNVVSSEVQRARSELETRVNQELSEYQDELDDLIGSGNDELQIKVDLIDGNILDQQEAVDVIQAKIEARIEEEKNKLQQQAEDKLKDEAEKLLENLKF